MKRIFGIVTVVLLLSAFSLQAKEVKVYYFHATKRCATCTAVEKVTKETLKKHYDGKVEFILVNREKEKNHPLIKKHKIKWQTLLVVSDEKTLDLTNDAFLTARKQPEKLEKKIQIALDSMLK